MDFERQARMAGLCAFCDRHTHDFPDDEWHDSKHAAGWHTCSVDGYFRQSKPFCGDFKLSEGVHTTF